MIRIGRSVGRHSFFTPKARDNALKQVFLPGTCTSKYIVCMHVEFEEEALTCTPIHIERGHANQIQCAFHPIQIAMRIRIHVVVWPALWLQTQYCSPKQWRGIPPGSRGASPHCLVSCSDAIPLGVYSVPIQMYMCILSMQFPSLCTLYLSLPPALVL